MPIPNFEEMMLPILKCYGDNKDHTKLEVREKMVEFYKLTPEEVNTFYESGNHKIFYHRLSWAFGYLKQARLLDNIERGTYRITQRGLDVLKSNPLTIDIEFLKQYPEFRKFSSHTKRTDDKANNEQMEIENKLEEKQSPLDLVEAGIQELKTSLATELLAELKKSDPLFFQEIVAQLLVKMGYGGDYKDVIQGIKKGTDKGVDGIIKEDRLGIDKLVIQAKRWDGNSVGSQELQQFESVVSRNGGRGVFVTTSYFTEGAREIEKTSKEKIVLIDGEALANLMIEYNLGVSLDKTYDVKKIDYDYFQS